jgi:hypothetical protein
MKKIPREFSIRRGFVFRATLCQVLIFNLLLNIVYRGYETGMGGY